MGLVRSGAILATLFVVLVGCLAAAGCASTYISDSVIQSHGSVGRRLLQTQTNCPVDFQFMNYTIIISQCKGPRYPAAECCKALVDFACPYAAQLNDATNNCASVMFSYINMYGSYPPGLFSSECHGDKNGLPCPAPPPQSYNSANTRYINQNTISLFALVCGLVLAFLSC